MRDPRDIQLTPMMAVTVILWVAFGFACFLLVGAIAMSFAPGMSGEDTIQVAFVSGLVAAVTGPAAALLRRRQRSDWSSPARKVEASTRITFVASAALLIAGVVLTGISYANAAPGGYYLAYPGLILMGIAGSISSLLRRGH